MDGDFQLVVGRRRHILGEHRQVHAVWIVGGIGGRQIPFGLRRGRARCERHHGEAAQHQATELFEHCDASRCAWTT
jgi:hypothetical protein